MRRSSKARCRVSTFHFSLFTFHSPSFRDPALALLQYEIYTRPTAHLRKVVHTEPSSNVASRAAHHRESMIRGLLLDHEDRLLEAKRGVAVAPDSVRADGEVAIGGVDRARSDPAEV
jgi:hypothetical protein